MNNMNNMSNSTQDSKSSGDCRESVLPKKNGKVEKILKRLKEINQ